MHETDRTLSLVGLRSTNEKNNNILFNFMNSANFNFIISAKEVMSPMSVSCLVGFVSNQVQSFLSETKSTGRTSINLDVPLSLLIVFML